MELLYRAKEYIFKGLMVKLTIFSYVALAAVLPVYAFSPDINGDGVTDIITVEIQGNSLVWRASSTAPSALSDNTQLAIFGKKGDIPIAGRYLSSTKTTIGVLRKTKKGIKWLFLNTADNSVEVIEFGKSTDIVLAGGDFDGDGFDDLMVRTKKGVYRFRRTGLNPSNDDTGVIERKFVGKKGMKVFYDDVNHDGRDDICKIIKKKSNKNILMCFDFILGTKILEAKTGKVTGQPMPIGMDMYIIPKLKKSGGKKTTLVRVFSYSGPSTVAKVVFVGNDNDIVKIEDGKVAALNGNTMEVFDVSSNSVFQLSAPVGTSLIDEFTVLANKSNKGKLPCTSKAGWGAGAVWKPISESDGKLVILDTHGADSKKAFIVNSKGKVIGKGRYVGNTNGDRPTFRFPKRGAEYGNNIYAVFQTGNKKVCRFVKNGAKRED